MNPRIVTLLLVWILACGARHIPEKRHNLHHNRDSSSHSDEISGHKTHHRLSSRTVKRTGEEVSPVKDVVDENSIRSNEIVDGFGEYPVKTKTTKSLKLFRKQN